MAEIPEAVLEEIKRRIDLVALISEHVALKRSGRGFTGLCPFHQEKTPSFHVDPQKGFFHCFGCNAGGNAFTFLMRVSGLAFPEAVRSLAARAGVTVPEPRAREGIDRLGGVNALAAELFAVVLHESRRAEGCRAYLAERGISVDTARRFQLGYAPAEGWPERLLARGVSPADLRTLGLASPSNRGPGLYPLLRDRLVFPIHDLGGRVIAFGGRAIGGAAGPKYLNSPESPIYRKGHHLYGLHLAREAIRESGRLLLVEGYLDAISLAQAGVGNVAGVLGTALTVDQLRLARRFADDIVVCFDGDQAGRRAAQRAFEMCVDEVDLWPRAVFFPAGHDPDSLVRREGPAALEALLAHPVSLMEFYLDQQVGGEAGPDRALRVAGRIAQILGRVRDPIVRDKVLRGAAGRLGVSEAALLDAAARSRSAASGASGGGRAGDARPGAALDEARRTTSAAPLRGIQGRRGTGFSVDAELVELLLCDAATAERAAREGVCHEIVDPELRRLAEGILERREKAEHFEPMELVAELPRAMADRVVRRLAQSGDGSEVRRAGEQWFEHRAGRLARAERRALISRLRAAEHSGDQAQVAATLEALRQDHERRGS